jgi:predicted metalloendopeptidase
MTKTEQRDPEKTYNKMTVSDLQAKCDAGEGGAIDWSRFFAEVGKPVECLGSVNVSTVDAVVAASAALKTTPTATLAKYFKWHVVHAHASFNLPKAFGDEHFEFYSKTLQGQKEQKPRWKRALQVVESELGEGLGQLYVAKHFAGEAKERAVGVVNEVKAALRGRLQVR